MKTLHAIALLAALGTAAAHQVQKGELSLAHPFIRLDPACPVKATRAQVMMIVNEGRQADRLLAAELQGAGKGTLVRYVNGVRQPVDGFDVPAGGTVALTSPAWAIEFARPKTPLVEGGAAKGTLTFQRAGAVAVTFMIDGPMGGVSDCPVAAPAPR